MENIDKILEIAESQKDLFNFSTGYREKRGSDGKFSDFGTLKKFKMKRSVRKSLEAQADCDRDVETYFLKFNKGNFLAKTKCLPSCFLYTEALLVKGECTVTKEGKSSRVKKGETISFDLTKEHSIQDVDEETIFLVHLRTR